MNRELKNKIMDLPAAREVELDVSRLADMEEGTPELLEDIFPFSEVPQFTFSGKVYEVIDGETVEFDFEERTKNPLVLSDTTFRDGQQARPPYTKDQMLDLYRLMARLSGPNQVISNSEFFLYSDNDIETVEACLQEYEENPSYPEPT
ncbi:MAG: hypothetical protein R6X33_09510, partial [Candidatus Brocadiia bacterium]